MGRALVTLYRLSTHPASDWDRKAVCKTVDLVAVVEEIYHQVSDISPEADRPFPDDFWTRGSLLMGAIRDWLNVPGREGSVQVDEAHAWDGVHRVINAGDPALQNWNATAQQIQSMHQPLPFGDPAILRSMGVPSMDPSQMQF